jgi:hypothetical protein
MTENKNDLISKISDLYKSIYGVRPRPKDPSLLLQSYSELQEYFNVLCTRLKDVVEKELREQTWAVTRCEDRIQKYVSVGLNREQAVSALMLDYGCNGDLNYLCFHLNVPYGYFK